MIGSAIMSRINNYVERNEPTGSENLSMIMIGSAIMSRIDYVERNERTRSFLDIF